jgi:hypothetical protein
MNELNFESEKGDVPEFDLTGTDLITSLITTFESNDLHARTAINFSHDKKTDYVFMDVLSIHNGKKLIDIVFGFDKEKILSMCENIRVYFRDKK